MFCTSGRTLESPDPQELLSVTQYLPAQYDPGKVVGMQAIGDLQNVDCNTISPFQPAYAYKFARFFHDSKTSLTNMDRFFNADLLTSARFKTKKVYILAVHGWINKMWGMVNPPEWQRRTVDFHLQTDCSCDYSDLEDIVRSLV